MTKEMEFVVPEGEMKRLKENILCVGEAGYLSLKLGTGVNPYPILILESNNNGCILKAIDQCSDAKETERHPYPTEIATFVQVAKERLVPGSEMLRTLVTQSIKQMKSERSGFEDKIEKIDITIGFIESIVRPYEPVETFRK